MIKLILTSARAFRKFVLRHLYLPRPSFLAVKPVDDVPNPLSGLYNFNHNNFQPWYVKPSFWATLSPVALFIRALGRRAPGTEGDKYHPQGYDLKTIGPKPQEGKGLDEMNMMIEVLKIRGLTSCPFHIGKS